MVKTCAPSALQSIWQNAPSRVLLSCLGLFVRLPFAFRWCSAYKATRKIKHKNSSVKDLALYFEFSNKDSYNKALKKYREDSPVLNGVQYIITERPSSNILISFFFEVISISSG